MDELVEVTNEEIRQLEEQEKVAEENCEGSKVEEEGVGQITCVV